MNLEGWAGFPSQNSKIHSSVFLTRILNSPKEGSQTLTNALYMILCPETAHNADLACNPEVSISLCVISMFACLGHTSFLASNATWPDCELGGFTAIFSLQLSVCVILRSLHHLDCAHSPSEPSAQTSSRHPQAFWSLFHRAWAHKGQHTQVTREWPVQENLSQASQTGVTVSDLKLLSAENKGTMAPLLCTQQGARAQISGSSRPCFVSAVTAGSQEDSVIKENKFG